MMRTDKNIQYGKFIGRAIGLNPNVYPYYDDEKKKSIDIVSIDDPIDDNVKFYSTIGLSNYPNIIEMDNNLEENIPVELLITGYKKHEKMANILATTSFYISKNNWSCQPGTVYKNVIKDYYETEMEHILFNRPFLWEDKFKDLSFGGSNLYPLLLIPISNKELEYKLENSYNALESLLAESEIDIFDIDRKSII